MEKVSVDGNEESLGCAVKALRLVREDERHENNGDDVAKKVQHSNLNWHQIPLLLLHPVSFAKRSVLVGHAVEIREKPNVAEDVNEVAQVNDNLVKRHQLIKGKLEFTPRI